MNRSENMMENNKQVDLKFGEKLIFYIYIPRNNLQNVKFKSLL